MKKLNFDNLTNIKAPESLRKSVLNVPNEKPKRAFFPVRFHHFAAGIAACVVIAAAVIFSLMLGFHRNIDMTAPDTPSRTDSLNDSIESTSIPDVSVPSTPPPSLSGEEAQNRSSTESQMIAQDDKTDTPEKEPAESVVDNSNASANQNPRSSTSADGSKKPRSAGDSDPKAENRNSGSDNKPEADVPDASIIPNTEEATQSSGEVPHRPSKDDYEVLLSAYEVSNPEPGSSAPVLQGNHYSFNTTIPSSYMVGNIFCLIENDKGTILGSGGLYSRNRELTSHSYEGDKVKLTFECYCIFYYGKTYTVNFYNSHGEMLKKGTITINGDFYREI